MQVTCDNLCLEEALAWIGHLYHQSELFHFCLRSLRKRGNLISALKPWDPHEPLESWNRFRSKILMNLHLYHQGRISRPDLTSVPWGCSPQLSSSDSRWPWLRKTEERTRENWMCQSLIYSSWISYIPVMTIFTLSENMVLPGSLFFLFLFSRLLFVISILSRIYYKLYPLIFFYLLLIILLPCGV